MKNKKYLVLPAFALVALLGAGVVSAKGMGGGMGLEFIKNSDPVVVAEHFNSNLLEKANILGISVDQMKTKWAEGKNVKEIALELGIDQNQLHEKMQLLRQEQMKNNLQNLVSQGIITQAQADSRLEFMKTKESNNKFGEGRMGGMGRGMHYNK